ncbi:MAG: hypothetical protein LBH93_08805 [Chitinispirillales bacterium]|jgi:hypothetical protein|nr:hypothetical protein [Chitinispirillales bacterium]
MAYAFGGLFLPEEATAMTLTPTGCTPNPGVTEEGGCTQIVPPRPAEAAEPEPIATFSSLKNYGFAVAIRHFKANAETYHRAPVTRNSTKFGGAIAGDFAG